MFIPGLGAGERYKFEIRSRVRRAAVLLKADPYAPPGESAAAHGVGHVARLGRYAWRDDAWMAARRERDGGLDRPDVDLRGAPRVVAPQAAEDGIAR